ncbi:unnamed protein product [Alopecurus aequalis]
MNLALDIDGDEMSKLPPSPYLPHELIVSEILVRLPVTSLLRSRCVCKAWRDTVSGDTSFSQAHVYRHQPQKKRPSSLLIAPYIRILDGELFGKFATPGLYLWEENQQQDGVATLVHDMAWFPVKHWWQTRHGFAHCDGLVMLPGTKGTVRVLNPATRRSLTLPWSPDSTWRVLEGRNAFGFGRVPSSGVYKVAHFFHHDSHTLSMGMEVFTVGDDRWRETAAKPPCPFMEGRTATFFKGSLIWTVDFKSHAYHGTHAPGASDFVRFSLEDESFSVMAAPPWYPGPNYEESRLAELHGELTLSRLNKESVEIWMCDDVDDYNPPRWARRYVLNSSSCIHTICAFNDEIVFRDRSYYLYRHQTSEGSRHMVGLKPLKYRNPDTDTLVECSSVTFDGFDVTPYIPTLVPI